LPVLDILGLLECHHLSGLRIFTYNATIILFSDFVAWLNFIRKITAFAKHILEFFHLFHSNFENPSETKLLIAMQQRPFQSKKFLLTSNLRVFLLHDITQAIS